MSVIVFVIVGDKVGVIVCVTVRVTDCVTVSVIVFVIVGDRVGVID